MDNFEFFSPTRFVFGRGAESRTGELVRKYGGTKVLLHFGGGSVKANGVYDKVVAALTAAGVAYVPLGGVQPNPRDTLVYQGLGGFETVVVSFNYHVGQELGLKKIRLESVYSVQMTFDLVSLRNRYPPYRTGGVEPCEGRAP